MDLTALMTNMLKNLQSIIFYKRNCLSACHQYKQLLPYSFCYSRRGNSVEVFNSCDLVNKLFNAYLTFLVLSRGAVGGVEGAGQGDGGPGVSLNKQCLDPTYSVSPSLTWSRFLLSPAACLSLVSMYSFAGFNPVSCNVNNQSPCHFLSICML